MKTPSVKLGGFYQHYKGKMYKVHQIVRHTETLEELVCYEALYENDLGSWWVRPLKMFTEEIEINGVRRARFELQNSESLNEK